MTTELSELQRDALVEIFNVGVGRAAHSLSQIVNEEVALSVPKVDILQTDQMEALNALIRSPRVCAVSQDFTGLLDAKAFLVFPEGKTLEIVRRMLDESLSIGELGEMEQEALSEIGNIILNSCIGAMSEVLHTDFHSSLPTYHLGTVNKILGGSGNDMLMLLHIDFSIPSDQIDGHLVFLLTLSSFNSLIRQIDHFLLSIA